MAKIVYHVENAPGKVYGKNSNELVFKQPNTNANIYTTATDTGLLRSTKKHVFRGSPNEKEGGVCIATIDEPSNGTLEMHHHPTGQEAPSSSTKLKLKKTSSWVPLSGNNLHAVTFRDSTYTWSGKSTLKRDRDGRVVAKLTGSWFWQGKLADMELYIPEEVGNEEERRETLEMVVASFVLRWWSDKVEEEEKAKERAAAQKEQKEVKKAVAKEKKEAKQEEVKKHKKEEEVKKLGETALGAAPQDVPPSGDGSHV
ncbi:hypothetical protein N0V82_003029 [Gnomoniopsis sp. IMI 355080]|nr:hypothetical protein N0V82_003029 [Gnomoniopsis sp. IMI 355080]